MWMKRGGWKPACSSSVFHSACVRSRPVFTLSISISKARGIMRPTFRQLEPTTISATTSLARGVRHMRTWDRISAHCSSDQSCRMCRMMMASQPFISGMSSKKLPRASVRDGWPESAGHASITAGRSRLMACFIFGWYLRIDLKRLPFPPPTSAIRSNLLQL
eukprot:51497-Chlamydomonas_euryale.AAC.13